MLKPKKKGRAKERKGRAKERVEPKKLTLWLMRHVVVYEKIIWNSLMNNYIGKNPLAYKGFFTQIIYKNTVLYTQQINYVICTVCRACQGSVRA